MKVEIESEFEKGDKVKFWDNFDEKKGVICEVSFERNIGFSYLIEFENHERIWEKEKECNIYKLK